MKYHSKRTRLIATFFLLIFLPSLFPVNVLYASNNGPNAPEASGFESVNATDMVNLSTGDMAYVLPVMDVDGFPISLSYHGGIPLDLESTWTGLGWNLNTGAVNRGLNATADDWNGGNTLDFIRFEDSEEIFSVNVGVGIASAVEVGVGASFGSNKGMTGSVFASAGVASARIDTDGNYTLGLTAGLKYGGQTYGGGVSMSGNVNNGNKTYGVNAGMKTAGGLTVGVGASLDGGVSASLGYSGVSGNGMQQTGQAGGGSISTANFSSGDWDISSKGWYVPIQVGFISFGFGKQKVTQSLKKGYNKKGFGILYSNIDAASPTTDAIEVDNTADGAFTDYQNRFRYIDSYDQALPVTEEEFVGDYDAGREKLNFSFAGYDSYDVNAMGISGMMTPKVLHNATVFGLGYTGADPKSTDGGKLKIYHHNTLPTTKTFGKNLTSDTRFYFNGQFTQNRAVTPLAPSANTNPSTLSALLGSAPAPNNTRLKQGNFVEVFTNKQIRANQANGMLSPLNPTSDGTALTALSRTASEYKDEGIGGYKITAPDGKVYHFSQPVYHFEQVERNILLNTSEEHVSEKRQYTSYATHWLLTAITGPDYVDNNDNNIADPGDYGFWTRMDYGKWSDGYVWRTPTDKNLKDYNTNITGNIGRKEFGTYQFGRKQLYYLDRVVSASHTAYFVKNLRYDSSGCDLNYKFTPSVNLSNDGTGVGNDGIYPQENFTYKRQMQLMLEKIILVKNADATVSKGASTDPLKLNVYNIPDYVKSYQPGFTSLGGFYKENNVDPLISINNESSVYDSKDFDNFDYGNAIKVVALDYNYNLAVKDHTNNLSNPDPAKSAGSPGAIACLKNPNAGKLALKQVKFLGRNNFDYMPPYQFEYIGEFKSAAEAYVKYPANAIVQKKIDGLKGNNFQGSNLNFDFPNNVPYDIPIANVRAKDEWGFYKDVTGVQDVAAASWTMNKIITPTGASIKFEHEEDDYLTEAFSRRYWTEDLRMQATDLGNTIEIEIRKQTGSQAPNFYYTDYFSLGDRVFLDLWICKVVDEECLVSSFRDTGIIDIRPQDICTVYAVGNDYVKIRVAEVPNVTVAGDDPGRAQGTFYSRGGPDDGSQDFQDLPRGECTTADGGCGAATMRKHSMKYRLLANKVPKDQTGGGLRVKAITLTDENNNNYKTSYYYNIPGFGKKKTDTNYKSSGITSYSPVRGVKFIPYQSELPNPGVMYEYVTMVAEESTASPTPRVLGETLYRFYVLRPVNNIFTENIEMLDDDGVAIFKATVQNNINSPDGYLNTAKKVISKTIKLEVNTSLIGQFRSIEEFNNKGQLMSRTDKKYLSGSPLKALAAKPLTDDEHIDRGSVTESFQSMKSIFTTNSDNGNLQLKNRYLSISSKEEHSSVLKSVITTGMNGISTETYKKTDPETGAFTIVETVGPDARKKRIERVAAYKNYLEMGSKAVALTNKHMLSQEALVIESAETPSSWRTLSAQITTWNKTWKYRDDFGAEVNPGLVAGQARQNIWRKQKNYIWKDAASIYGGTATTVTPVTTSFTWSTGLPVDVKWQKASEITRYNHYSAPLEVKDANNNYVSSKMADSDNKVLLSGNARYTEMYFSGAEHVVSGNTFAGEVQGATYRSSTVSHTGKYSVKAESYADKVFAVTGSSGSETYDGEANYPQTFRPGVYKVSFWRYNNYEGPMRPGNETQAIAPPTSNLYFNGSPVTVSEIVDAGCWQQLNYYITIPPNVGSNTVYVYSMYNGSSNYFDDFRMHPVASTINSFVYDEKTDELTYKLDSNNMGSAYKYDNAGRLIATYKEVFNEPGFTGGFKITSQNKQRYKNSTDATVPSPAIINHCLN